MRRVVPIVAAVTLLFAGGSDAPASIILYQGSGTGGPVVAQAGYGEDLFQAPVSVPLAALDFEAFCNRDEIAELTVGLLAIHVNPLGNQPVLEIISSSLATPPQGAAKITLFNCVRDTASIPNLEFVFSEPVQRSARSVFDSADNAADQFTMVLAESGAAALNSSFVDSVLGNAAYAVEGSFDAVSDVAVEHVAVSGLGDESDVGLAFFEVGGIRIILPEPATIAVWSLLGLSWAGVRVWGAAEALRRMGGARQQPIRVVFTAALARAKQAGHPADNSARSNKVIRRGHRAVFEMPSQLQRTRQYCRDPALVAPPAGGDGAESGVE